MNPRLTNKRLVRFLMDEKGLDMITITSKAVLVQVSPKFTPKQAEELCKKAGRTDFKAKSQEGLNFIVFPRY